MSLSAALLAIAWPTYPIIESHPQTRPLKDFCLSTQDRLEYATGLKQQTVSTLGTATRVGDAWVTNYHVIDGCPEKVIAYDPIKDLALLERGDPGECLPPTKTMAAYGQGSRVSPDWDPNCSEPFCPNRYEQATSPTGAVTTLSKAYRVEQNLQYSTGIMKELSVSQSEWVVTWGFSGGAIYVVPENQNPRLGGIIFAANSERFYGVEITDVCSFIHAGNHSTGDISEVNRVPLIIGDIE